MFNLPLIQFRIEFPNVLGCVTFVYGGLGRTLGKHEHSLAILFLLFRHGLIS